MTEVVFRRESVIGNAALTGVLSAAYYAPWDVVGAKHLWWSWHTTDLMLKHRWLGVPVASTMFTLVFGFTWSLCLHLALFKNSNFGTANAADAVAAPELDRRSNVALTDAARTIAAVGCGSVPLMMVTMTLLQSLLGTTLPPAPPPTIATLVGTSVVLVAAAVFCTSQAPRSHRSNPAATTNNPSALAAIAVAVHFGFLMATVYTVDPAHAVSTGV